MYSSDTSTSYGTLGILPISVNSNIHHHHHDYSPHNYNSLNSNLAPYHHHHHSSFPLSNNQPEHSEHQKIPSNYISISSSSLLNQVAPLQPKKRTPSTSTQVQRISYSTSTAAPTSSYALSLIAAEVDCISRSIAQYNESTQPQSLYQDCFAQTATFSTNHGNNNDVACTTTGVETTCTIVTGSQQSQSTKTSPSSTNITAAQPGGNSTTLTNHSNTEYTDMSSGLGSDGDFIVRALHEYHTDSEGHLSFSQFQYIKVRHCDASGWWFGESENNHGWFPSNRVERVATVYESEYLSRPTSITSEDYDQIRTGLDGVEIQFLGEPVMESVIDNIQMEWGGIIADSNSNGVPVNSNTTVHTSAANGRTRAGQLAFPSTQLSVSQSQHCIEGSRADMESEMFYQRAISSTTSANTADISYAYSDFVSEITLYVMELRDATSRAELERYQAIVAKIFSCVKALLIFTNTIARDSPVLSTYPELARSRRVILRALGKLYSKCRVANGSQTPTTTRQRQFATEKLGIFSGQVLEGMTDFTACAREIGLRIRAEAVSAQEEALEMVLTTKGEVDTSPPSSNSHIRARRRVSRANSAKGFKSFNAVRQWRAEHLQKHNAAKKTVECLLSEYMECLNGNLGSKGMTSVIRMTMQSAQTVEAFFISADDARVRAQFKEDEQYITHKTQLSSTLNELFEFLHIMEGVSTVNGPSSEIVLNRLMNLASVLLKCLIDMEIPSKAQGGNQDSPLPFAKRISFSRDEQDSHPLPIFVSNTGFGTQADARSQNSPSGDTNGRSTRRHQTTNTTTMTPTQKVSVSRNTAPARPKQTSALNSVQGFPLNRKFASLNSLSDRYKRQASEEHHCPEMDALLSPEAVYGEAHDLEQNQPDFYRSNHDSAVVIMSGKNTPHHSLMNVQKGAKQNVPIVEEETQIEPSDLYPKDESNQDQIIKDAERTVLALFLPTTEASHQMEQVYVPIPEHAKQRTSLPVQADPVLRNDPKSPPRPALRQQCSYDSQPIIIESRAARLDRPAMDSSAFVRMTWNQQEKLTIRSEQLFSDMERREQSLEIMENTGLCVSMPLDNRIKNSVNQVAAGSGTNPRSLGTTRGHNPTPVSPKLESSKRMPREDPSPHSQSSKSNSESRTFNSRSGGHAGTNLSPGLSPSNPRRGSEHSIRNEMSLPRKSSDSQAMREHESRQDYQDRRQLQHQHQQTYHQQQSHSSLAPGRRNSKISMSGPLLRGENHVAKSDDNVFSGLTTPATPQIQTFLDGQSVTRRTARTQRRESVVSNLSVATESSAHSRNGGRPISPSMRNRINNHHHQDANSIRGRVSIESTVSLPQQQTRGGPSPTSYRPRQNRAGVRSRLSGEFQNDNSAQTINSWFLGDDYDSDEVYYNENGVLVAATLEAYIEMLTSHKDAPDSALVMTFFTTFRLFTSPLELTELLIKRFMKAPPSGLNENELMKWAQQKQERIQKRVHIAFKTWLEGYWVSEKDREAFRPIVEFVTHEMKKTLPGPAGRLLDMLTQWGNKRRSLCLGGRSQTINKARSHDRLNQYAQDHQSNSSSSSSSSNRQFATVKDKGQGRKGLGGLGGRDSTNSRGPPAPNVTKALLNALSNEQTMCKVPVTDVKAIELARQITIMVSKLYADIPYLELLCKDKPNCSRMIQVSNKITEWLIETVVDEQDVKKRTATVKHWIDVGEECLKMNNFDTLMAITNGIESTPVSRLYNTWEGINKVYLERFLQLKKAISSEANYSAYRNKLKTISTPCTPFLGLYFKAITYIEDGNSPYKELTSSTASQTASASTGTSSSVLQAPSTPVPVVTRKLLRYGRFHQLAKTVQEFRSFQGTYELLEVPRLRDYIMKCMENQEPEKSYDKSMAIEPRRPAPSNVSRGSGRLSGGNMGGQTQRSSGGHRGVFHGGMSSSEMNGGSVVKSNKLSFFRKSIRSDRS